MSNQTSDNNKRIAKNTIMLYLRMFLTMVVGLYTSRVVLLTLGVEDYGIYGVVGGVVAMMEFGISKTRGATKCLSDGSTQLSEPLLDRVDCLYTGWGFPNR